MVGGPAGIERRLRNGRDLLRGDLWPYPLGTHAMRVDATVWELNDESLPGGLGWNHLNRHSDKAAGARPLGPMTYGPGELVACNRDGL